MPVIIIQNLFNKEIPVGDLSRTLLGHFQDQNLDWLHSCGGKGRCTTCKVVVTEGVINLSDLSEAEVKYRNAGLLAEKERLSCQVWISGDVVVSVPEESKLPHVKYSG